MSGPALVAAQDSIPVGRDALDLAEMVPLPEDIQFLIDPEPASVNRSEYQSQQLFIDSQSAAFNEIDDVFTLLTDAGFQQAYVHEYSDARDEGQEAPAVIVRTRLSVYADDDGAADVYALLQEHLDAEEQDDGIGDASFIFEHESENGNSLGMELTFQTENIVATAELWITGGGSPDQDALEEVADSLLDRIEAGLDGDGVNLGLAALRPDYQGTFGFDGYRLVDGQPLPRTTETPESVLEWTGEAATAYHIVVGLSDPRDEGETLGFQTRLLGFETDDAASEWVQDAETYMGQFSQIVSAEEVDSPDDLGDESRAIRVVGQRASGEEVAGIGVVTRVGSVVTITILTALLEVPVEAVAPLADQQVTCIEDGACDDVAAVEAAVIDGEDASSGGSDDQSNESGAQEDGDVYESPLYGYTITYESSEWTVSTEDDSDPDDEYEQVTFEHELGLVGLVGDPDYDDGDLDACVADYEAGLEQADGVGSVQEIRDESGEDDSRSWAVFSYEIDGESDDRVRYIECRRLDDGVTLVVLQDSLEDDFPALSEARDDLMRGFEPS